MGSTEPGIPLERMFAQLDEFAPEWPPEDRDRLEDIKKHLPWLRSTENAAISHAASATRSSAPGTKTPTWSRRPISRSRNSWTAWQIRWSPCWPKTKEELHAANRALNWAMAVTVFVALTIGTSVAIFLSRTITAAARSILNQAEAIAADLTRHDLKVRSSDELGDLTAAINEMSGRLKRMVLAIHRRCRTRSRRQRQAGFDQPADHRPTPRRARRKPKLEMSTQLRSPVGQFKINAEGSGTRTAECAKPAARGMAAHASA
jgi:methyl-accepting chemotaxis protein